ncbi:MAG: hypothetical protein AAFS03_11165 [Pseudomonadota bacterium]
MFAASIGAMVADTLAPPATGEKKKAKKAALRALDLNARMTQRTCPKIVISLIFAPPRRETDWRNRLW